MHFWFDSSNYFLVRLNALIRPFSFGVYNVHAIVFAFLSFIGTYNLYLFFENKVISKKYYSLFYLEFHLLFSGHQEYNKEAIVIFALGTILYNLDEIIKSSYTKRNVFFAIFGLIVLGYIRIYLLAFLLPLMAAMILYNRFESRETSKVFLGCIAIFIGLVFLIDMYTPNLSFLSRVIGKKSFLF